MGRAPALLSILLVATAASAQEGTGPSDPASVLDQVQAQVDDGARPDSPQAFGPILVLNQDRLLAQSEFGRRIQAELAAAADALTRENREIEARLTEEELGLTELRPTMPPADFALLAEEFDARVEGIRAAQDAKSRDLQAQAEAAQARFFELVTPILLDLVRARGASVLLDNRTVLLSAQGIDVTDAALAAIDAEIGAGGPDPLVSFDPAPDPDTATGD